MITVCNHKNEQYWTNHLKGLRLYLQGDNLFLCSRYPGWDPETSVNLDPRFYGEDNDGVPQPRIFKLGVNITF